MQKPKDYSHERPRNPFKSAWLELLWAERLVLEFLHSKTNEDDTVTPTTKIPLSEFWKYLETKKQSIDEKFEE